MQARRKQFKSGERANFFHLKNFKNPMLVGRRIFIPLHWQEIQKAREEKVRDLPNNKFIFRGEGGNEPILYT
jgi:hypothetical protein